MIIPTATYRLQFRNGMTFDRAAELAPYLARLGISHLYAAPIFKAEPGSTHGYDVVDNRVIDPDLGGDEGFDRMVEALRAEGIGIVLDFVPNHMSASTYNPYWRDVLEWGEASDCAQFFDIDWEAPKLLVPALGSSYGEALEAGQFRLSFDPRDGGLTFTYYELKLPLTPTSYAQVLMRADREDFAEWARRFAVATPQTSNELKLELAEAAKDEDTKQAIEMALRDVAADIEALHELHEMQVWRLTLWRAARETLTYRRFFEITDLVGIKEERPRVFEEMHERLFELIEAGKIDGLRLDHIDGLADPKAYFERLQKTVGETDPFYIVIEKILGVDEDLRADWPVAGTTGYEFIRTLAEMLTDPHGADGMTHAYNDFLQEQVDYEALILEAKRMILIRNLAGELEHLKDMAGAIAVRGLKSRDFGNDTLRRAIIELAAALPVYRTYVDVSGAQDEDRAILAAAADKAKASRQVEDEQAIDFLRRILELDLESPEDQALALEFAVRFQQTTGPVMAKALEDTAFYRYNRLIALNEVGGEPDRFGAPLEDFHSAMAQRLRRQAAGLSTTSTHDTKRGEDARARLYSLSEMPEAWAAAVRRWTTLNADFRTSSDDQAMPEPEVEWLFYQALAGAWPADLAWDDQAGLTALADRMAPFMLKAVREAKTYTSWTAKDAEYEAAVEAFTRAALDPARAGPFLQNFVAMCGPIFLAGAVNSLSQTAIKLTAPGVPDIYQGSELWELSLVDPDNRRPIDYDQCRALQKALCDEVPSALLADWRSGAVKMMLLHAGLKLRADAQDLFTGGAYLPLRAEGVAAANILAYAGHFSGRAVVTVVPRTPLHLLSGESQPLVPWDRWGDTAVSMTPGLLGSDWHNIVTGETHGSQDHLSLGDLLRHFPVAILANFES